MGNINGVPYSRAAVVEPPRVVLAGAPGVGGRRDSPNDGCGYTWSSALEVDVRGSRVILLLVPRFLDEVSDCFARAMAGLDFCRCQGIVSASSGLFSPRTTDPRKSFN